MRLEDGALRLSASDLGALLGCQRITALDVQAARGDISPPSFVDPALEVLQERGSQHEREYLDFLESDGVDVVSLDSFDPDSTVLAMRSGAGAIAQATLASGRWFGRADVLRRVEKPSSLGDWSYEVVDTKLSANTRASTILQLCLYSALIEKIQGRQPELMHVVVPGRAFIPETYRCDEYMAYFRLIQSRLEESVKRFSDGEGEPYPDPVEQCDFCRWWSVCNNIWRRDDHLSFVADIGRSQRAELREWGITTLAELAALPIPISRTPGRGTAAALERVREQARVQREMRDQVRPVYELLPLEADRGLASLPEPSDGDIFFDIEGDSFVGLGGREYLLGWAASDPSGGVRYERIWSVSDYGEKAAFEKFVDYVFERWKTHPDLHVYHFHHYEPTALKRLMGRYATREDELDQILRAGLFVDLHRITRDSIRAGIERYSIKDLEQFYGLDREVDLRVANRDRYALERLLELGQLPLPDDLMTTVEVYNRDDCVSTLWLRNWLEDLRAQRVNSGEVIERPAPSGEEPLIELSARMAKLRELSVALLEGVPVEQADRSGDEQAKWILGNLIEYFRREEKAPWWEYFRLAELGADELLEDPAGISGLIDNSHRASTNAVVKPVLAQEGGREGRRA